MRPRIRPSWGHASWYAGLLGEDTYCGKGSVFDSAHPSGVQVSVDGRFGNVEHLSQPLHGEALLFELHQLGYFRFAELRFPAALVPAYFRRGKACCCTFKHHIPFELGKRAQDVDHHLAHGPFVGESFGQGPEVHAAFPQLLDGGPDMGEVAPEPVQPPHHERVTCTAVILPPKQGSERVVYVAEELVQVLARHVEAIGVFGAEHWLFGYGGTYFNRNSAADRWRQVREIAGIGEFTLHDLRHFYASGLIADGCDVVTVQRALGHAVPSITLNTYSHLWPTAEDKTRTAGSRLIAAALGDSADSLRTVESSSL
jgi:hypothetical protein